ncbi:L-rhamnose mutarotase [Streptomyces broussonetiae]|uniref:L-rhamnose mutarotase n=1 Tax=Streptomyces broussonetiae TaxID=2686304 RepID=A0A6I6N6T9_9ACTN|nr:L-rhamnose mutarotase [Streptomyces broussonetiae]QHA08918.1 L-rhamnose mutarotase [Streptomyces broussonetiae]
MRRVAQVIRIRPELREKYCDLHRDVPQPVLDTLRDCNIGNYSIHLLGDLLFGYFEYHGDDLAADMARMAADEATQSWWRLTAPCQQPVEEAEPGQWWAEMEQVFLMP